MTRPPEMVEVAGPQLKSVESLKEEEENLVN